MISNTDFASQSPITTNPSIRLSPQGQPPSCLPPEAIDLATKVFNLARNGETDTLSAYLRAGIPHDLTNASGDTLLMLSSYHGHVGTVKALIDAGAGVNVLNDRGQSPIAGAVFKGWDEVVKILHEAGADVGIGRPNAVECARVFGNRGALEMFGAGKGDGQ